MPIGFTRLQAFGSRPQLKHADTNAPPNLQVTQRDQLFLTSTRGQEKRQSQPLFEPLTLIAKLWEILLKPLRGSLSRLGLNRPATGNGQGSPVPLPGQPETKNPFAAPSVAGSASAPLAKPFATPVRFGRLAPMSDLPKPIGLDSPVAVKSSVDFPQTKEEAKQPSTADTERFWAAALSGNVKALRQAISRGVDINVRQPDGTTALHHAVERNHFPVVLALLETGKVEVNARDRRGIAPINRAVMENRFAMAEVLLKHGADVEAHSWFASRPLHQAASSDNPNLGNAKMIALLLREGAAVNARTWLGNTPLAAAASKGNLPAVELLLKHGALPEIRNHLGETALHGAARGGPVLVLRRLLDEEGLDPNAPDNLGYTPMHRAAENDRLEALTMLAAHGGRWQTTALDGKTPQQILAQRRRLRENKL